MFSDKPNINILTALLIEHHIAHAVVCPGSRNAPIVHNICLCSKIHCVYVTDERSAGFYALGMAMKSRQPVAACVTSGSALLNLLPAVAEAFYQHIPLLVISADRPLQWIDQLDGQTMPQQDVLRPFVSEAVSLPEPRDEEEIWFCNRLVNQALNGLQQMGGMPVHINVPVSEPLYRFNTPELANQRIIFVHHNFTADLSPLFNQMLNARRPMIVIGQTAEYQCLNGFSPLNIVVLHEALSVGALPFEKVLAANPTAQQLLPDFILYIGGAVVSKRLKTFLRNAKHARCWHVNNDGHIYDTFKCLEGVVQCPLPQFITQLKRFCNDNYGCFDCEFQALWKEELKKAEEETLHFHPPFSSMMAVKLLEQKLQDKPCDVHYANSSAIRLANIYARHHVWCNRGINGIEGSLSTAAGFSLLNPRNPVYCVIGDLSFFYDQNALWNQQLKGNLRILLLNNGEGAIFEGLNGARQSPAFHTAIAAAHHTSAEGVCRQNNIAYQAATDENSLKNGIEWLVGCPDDCQSPLLLEVFTSPETDNQAVTGYFACF